jgi:hypothetical protein
VHGEASALLQHIKQVQSTSEASHVDVDGGGGVTSGGKEERWGSSDQQWAGLSHAEASSGETFRYENDPAPFAASTHAVSAPDQASSPYEIV